MLRAIIVLILLFIASLVRAQKPNFRFIQYGLADGLSQSVINRIYQDGRGYIWVATEDGLNRFDGQTFKVYRKAGYPLGLPWGNIYDIAEDTANHKLWLGTSDKGLCILDFTSERFFKVPVGNEKLVSDNINGICLTNKFVWVATKKGIAVLDRKNMSVKKNFSLDKEIIKVVSLHDEVFYGFSKEGTIYEIDPDVLTIRQTYTPQQVFGRLLPKIIEMVFSDSQGEVWLCTNNGLYKGTAAMLKSGITFRQQILITSDDKNFSHSSFYSFFMDSQKNQWVGVGSSGLLFKREGEQKFYLIGKNNSNPYPISDMYIIQTFEDRQGNIWFGTEKGLNRLMPKTHFFTTIGLEVDADKMNRLFAVATRDDSIVITGRQNELNVLDTRTMKVTPVSNQTGTDLRRVYIIEPKGPVTFWVGMQSGIRVLERKYRGYVLRNPTEHPELQMLKGYPITTFVQLDDNNFLIGGLNNMGVAWWDKRQKTLTFLRPKDNDVGATALEEVNKIYPSKDGTLWIATNDGLWQLNWRTKKFTYPFRSTRIFKDTPPQVNDIIEDGDNVWMTFFQEGLCKWNKKTGGLKLYSQKPNSGSNAVYNLRDDGAGNIWVSTTAGLAAFNKQKEQFINYTVSDGIQDNEFNRFCVYETRDNIYFGGISGLTIISKQKIKINHSPYPPIEITEFRYLDKSGNYVAYPRLFENKIRLNHTQNNISIQFASLDFSTNYRTEYEYKLDGYDDDWVAVFSSNTVNYTNLKPGDYIFKVKGVNAEFVGRPIIKEFFIHITPAFYQTVAFKLITALFALSILLGLYRWRIQQLKKEQVIRSKLASDLHDDLGSTLNSVNVYTNLALMKNGEKEYLYKIKEGIQEAMNTTRDIVWMLDDESDTVEHLNYRISQFALSLCQANGVQFQREVDAEVMHHRLHQKEKRNLYLIMKEAINNSIKYADANEIRIKIYLEDKKLCVIIQDDGKGFCLPCVEEGNGLSNIRLRAKEMNYHFTIYADLHKGTCIELREV